MLEIADKEVLDEVEQIFFDSRQGKIALSFRDKSINLNTYNYYRCENIANLYLPHFQYIRRGQINSNKRIWSSKIKRNE